MPQKHLLHIFPTFAVGGSQMRFAQLARLHGEHYRHTVISLDGKTDMAQRLAGLPVTCQSLQFDKRKPLQTWQQFRATLGAIRPDVLLTYNWGAVEWALINRLNKIARHIHIEDGFGPEEANRQLRRRVWARRLALSGKDTLVVLPSRNLERIALNIWSLAPERVRYIPNGIDCPRFAVDARDKPGGSVVIGTVASLRREKNIARLIRAFGEIAGVRKDLALELLIVGGGAERESLEQVTRELNLSGQVRFAGQSNRPEDWYPKMNIFALSSDTEQMPLGVLEAMAAALPVVATAVGDVSQVVSDENRPYVVPAENFTAALMRLIDDGTARDSIGAANERKARETFDENVMAERYAELIG
jgi:glycosyltransferase involved in cell wall biosynthesis